MGRLEADEYMIFGDMLKWLRARMSYLFGLENERALNIEISEPMEAAIDRWARAYEGRAPWCTDGIHSLQIPAAIASEFARLVTLEMGVTITGGARADYLTKQLQPFMSRIRPYTELGCALGGIVFKPYVTAGGISIDAIQGDCFFPTAFDTSGRMTGAIFTEQIKRSGKIYTRAESREYAGGTEKVKNRAFCSNTIASLGNEIPLESVPEWADIAPDAQIDGIDRPLYAYFRVPAANKQDRHSPLGVSVFASAMDTIRDVDEQYGRLIWEFRGGELAIDVDESALRRTENGSLEMPSRDARLYRAKINASSPDFYHAFSPALRDESLLNGLNGMLRIVEFQCGLAYGTLSNPQTIDKTAEEIKASKQRSFSTVRDIQKALQQALDDLIYGMDTLASLYQLAPAGAVKIAYDWDDSLISDPSERKKLFWQYVMAGKFPAYRFLSEFEGYTVEEAKAMVAEAGGQMGDPYVDA